VSTNKVTSNLKPQPVPLRLGLFFMPEIGIADRRVGRPITLITGHPDGHMKNRRLGLHGRRLKASLFVTAPPMIRQGHAPGSVSLAGAFYELNGRLSRGSTLESTEIPFKITYENYSSRANQGR